MNAKMRAWWFERQGLSGLSGSVSAVLSRAGWARTVGGANPYTTAFARTGASMAEIDSAVQRSEVHELPSARGCTYLVPREDFAIALKAGEGTSETAAVRTATKYLGVTEGELEALDAAVLKGLADGPLDPKKLRETMGGIVRNLGDEGKKRGQTTTLPLALGRLQTSGHIRRISIGGRLDSERFAYALWPDGPLRDRTMTKEEALIALARKFWRWIGPARLKDFQWFAGQGVAATKALTQSLNLQPVAGDFLILPEDRGAFESYEPPSDPTYALVANLDSILLLRRDAASLVDEVDSNRMMHSDRKLINISGVEDLSHHAILDRGRLIGLWEFDPEQGQLVHQLFVKKDAALAKSIEETETFIREQLGDFRSFSLDSPASRRPAIEFLRNGA